MKFLSFLCTKWMENCEALISSTHSFAYSYPLVKHCFLKIWETSKCHNFLIFQLIFIEFSLFCSKIFTLSSEIKLNLFQISPLIRAILLSSILKGHYHNPKAHCSYNLLFITLFYHVPIRPLIHNLYKGYLLFIRYGPS